MRRTLMKKHYTPANTDTRQLEWEAPYGQALQWGAPLLLEIRIISLQNV